MRRTRSKFRNVPPPLVILTFLLVVGGFVILSLVWFTNDGTRDRFSGVPVAQDAREMLPLVMDHMVWNKGENVLDYGCGNGAVGYYMILPKVKENFGRQYALEYVATNLQKAKTKYPDDSITYAVGNLLEKPEEFPYKDVVFDKIFAVYVFHLVHDLENLLGLYKAILRTGGEIGFTTLTENNLCFQMGEKLSKMPAWKEYLSHYEKTYHPSWSGGLGNADGEKKLRNMFRRAGFHVKYLKIGWRKLYSSTVDKQLDPLFWLSPIYENVPISLVPDLKIDMKRQFENITGLPQDATNFYMDNEYIMGVLQKL